MSFPKFSINPDDFKPKSPSRFNINAGHYGMEGADAHIREVVEQILIDQARWLDEVMMKVMNRKDYDACKSGAVGDEEKGRIIARYGLQLVNDYEVMGLQVLRKGKPIAKFQANFNYEDGQKIYAVTPQGEKSPDPDAIDPGRQGGFLLN